MRATLPAAPSITLSRVRAITGIGASGEMRRDLAIDEAVDHQVAHRDDPGPGDALKQLLQAG